MASGPLNYSTKIPAARSVSECQQLLAEAGAAAVAVMYEDRKPCGLSFRLETPHGMRDFSMPVSVAGVHKMLRTARDTAHIGRPMLESEEHAVRVAWRVIRDWLEAQLAIIAAQMATLDEVMLPYLQVESGLTLYEAYREREGLALEAGHG
jgi:hypothetical protein